VAAHDVEVVVNPGAEFTTPADQPDGQDDWTLEELVRGAIAGAVELLLGSDPIVRAGDDPEGVRQARIATRWLRSDLRVFRPILDRAWSEPLRRELAWLDELLGRVRDLDVLLVKIVAKAGELPTEQQWAMTQLLDRLHEIHRRRRDALLDALRSPRALSLLDRLVDAACAPRLPNALRSQPAAEYASDLLQRPWSKLCRRIEHLATPPSDAALHEVRKCVKQARYAFAAIAPVAGEDAREVAERLAELQDALGLHHDAVVAASWLLDAARDFDDREVAFAAGEIAGSFAADSREFKRTWPAPWNDAQLTSARVDAAMTRSS
jgi:CHAD domain-containing protein